MRFTPSHFYSLYILAFQYLLSFCFSCYDRLFFSQTAFSYSAFYDFATSYQNFKLPLPLDNLLF